MHALNALRVRAYRAVECDVGKRSEVNATHPEYARRDSLLDENGQVGDEVVLSELDWRIRRALLSLLELRAPEGNKDDEEDSHDGEEEHGAGQHDVGHAIQEEVALGVRVTAGAAALAAVVAGACGTASAVAEAGAEVENQHAKRYEREDEAKGQLPHVVLRHRKAREKADAWHQNSRHARGEAHDLSEAR